MNNPTIIKDERTQSVGDAGSRVGFNIISFGLLVDIFFRSVLYPSQSVWDLFALVVVSGFAATIYQARHKALPPHFLRSMLLVVAAVAAMSAVVVVIIAIIRQ